VKKVALIITFVFALTFVTGTALAWYAPVEGQPAYYGGNDKGYFIWHDGDGMHLRVQGSMMGMVFSGTIKTDGTFVDVHGNKLEYGDHYWLDNDNNVIHFKFTNAGGIDGLSFKVFGGEHLRFELAINGNKAHPNDIHLGSEGWHPASNHFQLRR
jgi:hypothetical protein